MLEKFDEIAEGLPRKFLNAWIMSSWATRTLVNGVVPNVLV
jgi:hypothetical protein